MDAFRTPLPFPISAPVAVVVSALAFGVGCGDNTYQPRVICHNANCQEPADPENDSLMWTLEQSMELVDSERQRPPFDGIELDTFWSGEEERCLMAHDLDNPDEAVDAIDAVEAVNDALVQRTEDELPLTRHHDEFTLLIELKGFVTDNKADAHSDRQRQLHAECVIDMARETIASAQDHDYDVEIIVMAFDPRLLVEIDESPDYHQFRDGPHRVRMSALQGIPRPLDSQSVPLDEYPDDIGIDMVSTHPKWTQSADLQAYDSRNWDLGFWSFNLMPDVLDAIERHRPDYITTSQAPSVSGWLDRR